jgi:hypothetical protein
VSGHGIVSYRASGSTEEFSTFWFRDGRFELAVPSDRALDLMISCGVGFVTPDVRAARAPCDLLISAVRTASIRGRLLRPDGGPRPRQIRAMECHGETASGSYADVDEEGRFEALEIDPRSERVEIETDVYAPFVVPGPFAPGEVREVEVRLELLPGDSPPDPPS